MATLEDLKRKLGRFTKEIETLKAFNVPVIPDKNGMFDRQCPKEQCSSLFKVNIKDWKNIVRDDEVFCPVCRNNSASKEYLPKFQQSDIIKNLHTSIKACWDNGYPILENIHSLEPSEEFDVHVQCETWNVRYAVSGVPYFCPCCGFDLIEKTAQQSINMLMLKAENISSIQASLEQSLSKDEAVFIAKSIIESSLSSCIGTLQAFSEKKYNFLSDAPAPFNIFQNTEKSSKLWMALKEEGYDTWLSVKEINDLVIFTNRRHLIEHKASRVDKKYLANSNDTIYKENERIVVRPEDIIILGTIVLKILNAINRLK